MSEEKLLSRLLARDPDLGTEEPSLEDDRPAIEHWPFGWLRGHQDRCIMLELRKKDGNILAVGYSWIEQVEFDPSDAIAIHAGDRQIRIIGRNLNGELRANVRLFEGLTRHRVPWIREASAAELLLHGESDIVVESIEW